MSQLHFPPSYKTSYSHVEPIDNVDQAKVKTRNRGLGLFLRRNITVSLALLLGFACIALVIRFTQWFSTKLPVCPSWSLDCAVSGRVERLYGNFGAVQGIVTAVYSIGLAALAFSAHSFSESALWPLIHQQYFSIGQMETYLEASRGSIPSTPLAMFKARTFDSVLVLLLTTIITLTPLVAAPVVGQVYNRGNMTVKYQGELKTGGGIGVYYTQSNPPGPVRERSSTLYTSWQGKFAPEPLPDYRNWFIERNLMVKRGNFTVETVRIQQDIECRGWEATPNDVWTTIGRDDFISFNTSMPIRMDAAGELVEDKWQHSEEVEVRDVAKLAVWVHNYTFDNANKTTATLIFAALNGDIEGGLTTKAMPKGARTKNVTSIACDVSVEMMEDTLLVGDAPGPAISINPMTNIFVIGQGRPGNPKYMGKMNEVALWFAVAPVANGAYVYGTQPIATHRLTRAKNDAWTIAYIDNFIRVSTGASMLGEVDKWGFNDPKHPSTVRFPSYFAIVKMDPGKVYLLGILPLVILSCGAVLMVWNVKMHRSMALPIMRKATLGEIIKSSQTAHIRGPAAYDQQNAAKPSSLEELHVQFREDETGCWGLYGAEGRSLLA
ncbi:hypothetical protein C7974DRAFT_419306 [Boeremia exigua]|uniref:uncharacterized protein n=1 Tax=Boeremia exigua TaxID=749465 RepID=UPI001E8CA9E6|nr:uncharacterized protein C7974DRAFT_419306 [Boeremia exigua]KAH6643726.1 hypothetical protein C7974DRAFT_419306 [Boeremia exigua]